MALDLKFAVVTKDVFKFVVVMEVVFTLLEFIIDDTYKDELVIPSLKVAVPATSNTVRGCVVFIPIFPFVFRHKFLKEVELISVNKISPDDLI